ncbi:MAG: hypothetical protein Harvfovirus25_7 [Harvfovirus sp.]|uniref:Ankyrin repeat protein n=1 Tax=Harvfovirus sp. TaxID=2487768 RepID=A0A3G5A232_9VIRU|nr:MAG: hypothetical protein Harvfovirus25_7 [Harvfovirus sp.]
MAEKPLIFHCLDELVSHEEGKTVFLDILKKTEGWDIYTSICEVGFEEMECSLVDLMCESPEMSTDSIDFAVKLELVKKNDLGFLSRYVNSLRYRDNWEMVCYIIRNLCDGEVVRTKPKGGKGILSHLVFMPIFNGGWFVRIMEYLVEIGYDIGDGGGDTLLDGAIYQRNVVLIKYLVRRGMKFCDGGRVKEMNGCDYVQTCVCFPYHFMDHKPCKDYQMQCFRTVEACVIAGYDICTKDKNGLTIVDYIEKYITRDKYRESYDRHMKLIYDIKLRSACILFFIMVSLNGSAIYN